MHFFHIQKFICLKKEVPGPCCTRSVIVARKERAAHPHRHPISRSTANITPQTVHFMPSPAASACVQVSIIRCFRKDVTKVTRRSQTRSSVVVHLLCVTADTIPQPQKKILHCSTNYELCHHGRECSPRTSTVLTLRLP